MLLGIVVLVVVVAPTELDGGPPALLAALLGGVVTVVAVAESSPSFSSYASSGRTRERLPWLMVASSSSLFGNAASAPTRKSRCAPLELRTQEWVHGGQGRECIYLDSRFEA